MEKARDLGARDTAPSPSSSSDSDTETLIHQNETARTAPRRGRSLQAAFQIAGIKSKVSGGIWSKRRYLLLLLLLSLPVVVLLVYFSSSPRRLFHEVLPAARADDPGERMRDAELRALYLLRNQQLDLLRLVNRTASSHSGYGSSGVVPESNSTAVPKTDRFPSPTSVPAEEFRSALLEQIKLNREIQKVLLSSHREWNASSDGIGGNVGADFADPGAEICRKVEVPAARRTIEWNPKKNRYLFAICLSGQMSNHLICLEKHMFFAALLNRALVLPSPKFDYQYNRVIDIKHINDCFGRNVVITFEEFEKTMKNKMHINRFICYMANPPCYVDEEHGKRLKGLGLSLPHLEAAWPEDAKSHEQKKRVAGDITSRFACDDEVLAVGDLFYAEVEEEWVMQPGGPLTHKCKTLIQPSHIITLTAERFVQTFLGRNYIALHFRRHGFLKFCNAKEQSCFFPIPQAAECILHVVERSNAPVIYLSTDAAGSETDLLQSLVVLNDKTIPLIKRPGRNFAEKWDALLYRNHLDADSQVEAMLDKTICAMSSVFIGSSGSTFTDDIFRLRKDWGSASVCDEYLCQGQLPNFMASNE